jgi:hypothetical protein
MSILEGFSATWEKRFFQNHYSYRDTQRASTVVLTELQSLALLASEAVAGVPGTVYYPFGYNARNNAFTGTRFRWPAIGDYAVVAGSIGQRGQCFANSVTVSVTEDTWIRLMCIEPVYGILVIGGFNATQIAAMGVTQTITEVEQFIGAGDTLTLSPTYGFAVVFRADSVAGTIDIKVEGNVGGGE